jgi:hypothetical protein
MIREGTARRAWRFRDMDNGKRGTTSTPVYVPYQTFLWALDTLRRDGIPGTGKIDKTIWDKQSGAIQGQLLLGFRFLGLADERNRVTPALPPLVEASPEGRKPILKKLIEEKYAKLFELDLATATVGQLDESMRTYGVSGSTLLRAVRFFVKACQESGIPISSRLTEKTKTTSNGTGARKRRGGVPRQETPNTQQDVQQSIGWEDRLLEKFPGFDPAWGDDLKAKWFEAFERLMKAKS